MYGMPLLRHKVELRLRPHLSGRADRIRLRGRLRSSCGENTCVVSACCSSRWFAARHCLALGADGGLATTDCQLGIDGMALCSSLTLFWSPELGFSHP